MTTRRELLSLFLGAPFALSACRKATHLLPPQGDLLGPSVERGHRLRDLPPETTLFAAPPTRKVRVAIVGGGPAGLSAAWRLLRDDQLAPRDVALFELEDQVGGTAVGGQSPVTRYPWGAHYVPVPGPNAKALIALLSEMGLVEGFDPSGHPQVAEDVLCRAPEERLYRHGQWYEGLYLYAGANADDLRQWQRFRVEIDRWANFRDSRGRPAFAIPTSLVSDDPEVLALDRQTLANWMDQRGFRSKRLRWLVDYACRDDYGLALRDDAMGASAWAGLFYFASRWGSMGAAGGAGAERHAAPLMTWPDGNGTLVRHLRDRVKTSIQTGHMVLAVRLAKSGGVSIGGAELACLRPDNSIEVIAAEHVIVATPRHVSRAIVRGRSESPGSPELESTAFDYGSWAVANVHLRARPQGGEPGSQQRVGVPFAWDNVFYDSPSLGYVVATHQSGNDRGPTVWTWYYALTDAGPVARKRLLGATQREWADIALSDLSRAHPDLPGLVDRIDVMRWGHAMVRPIVGSRAARAKLSAAEPLGCIAGGKCVISFAHTDLSGVPLFEEANDHGVRAAETVMSGMGIVVRSLR